MDEYIKLPTSLGLEISKILSSKYNIFSRQDKNGISLLEYTQDELNKIESLSLYNPTRNKLEGIEYLKKLKKLEIVSYGKNNNTSTTLSSDDIVRIQNISSLKNLVIINQNSMQSLDLTELNNLESVVLEQNDNLTDINGLDKLDKLKQLNVVENNKLYKIKDLNKILLKLKKLKLSLSYFSDCIAYDHKTFYMDMNSLQYMVDLKDNCCFVDEPNDLNPIKYSTNDALKFHQKCINVLNNNFSNTYDKMELIVGIECYLAKNVLYDYEALKNDYTGIINDKKIGQLGSATSAYNAAMYGTCISSGYSKYMSYLLKLLNIKNHIVNCTNNTNIASTYQKYILPEDGHHSVVSIDDYGHSCCDPCWDACLYQSGKDIKYILLAPSEMETTHKLQEKYITSDMIIVVPRNVVNTYLGVNDTKRR